MSGRVVHAGQDLLGEGPLWHPGRAELYWLDILNGRLQCWSESGGHREVLRVPYAIGAFAFTGGDELLLATERGFERYDPASGRLELMWALRASPAMRFNDGRVDPVGRFWAGTMPMDAALFEMGHGKLYRLGLDGSVQQMDDDLTIANGMDWTDDGRTMLLCDTSRRRILAYDFDLESGSISNRRTFIETDPAYGIPDGIVLDAEACLWVAGLHGGVLMRYRPDGTLDRVLELGTACPTSMCFGGADLKTLFVTSARFHLSRGEDDQRAGAILAIDLDVAGRAPNIFGAAR